MEKTSQSRQQEILEMIHAASAKENLPATPTAKNPDYDARQDILDWIESQGIYIRE